VNETTMAMMAARVGMMNLRRPVVQTVQRRGFAGHGHAPPPVMAGDFVPAAPKAPTNVAFFGESLGGWLDATLSNSTFASFSSRGLWPWAMCFPITMWMVGKMGMTREMYESSKNPGYSEAAELAYMQEDKERYTELVKKADDAVFEAYAAEKATEFAALSADDQKKYQDKYATELVAMRIKQAKESQLKWLAMVEKEMATKCVVTKAASSA